MNSSKPSFNQDRAKLIKKMLYINKYLKIITVITKLLIKVTNLIMIKIINYSKIKKLKMILIKYS